jgi:hypothetical protein
MAVRPRARDINNAVTDFKRAAEKLAAVKQAMGVSPTADEAVFTPQPYPLFLADWALGKPLVGRVVGWSVEPGSIPQPVVVFEDGGSTCLPLMVDMLLGMGGGGPMWIRDSAAEALAEAKAYVPPRRSRTGGNG